MESRVIDGTLLEEFLEQVLIRRFADGVLDLSKSFVILMRRYFLLPFSIFDVLLCRYGWDDGFY